MFLFEGSTSTIDLCLVKENKIPYESFENISVFFPTRADNCSYQKCYESTRLFVNENHNEMNDREAIN